MAYHNYELQIGKLHIVGTITYTDRCDCRPYDLHTHIEANHIDSIVDVETDEYLTVNEGQVSKEDLEPYGLTPTGLEDEIDNLVYCELEEEVA